MAKPPHIVVRAVDGKDPLIAESIQAMHREVFGGSAPQVATWEGWWWIAYAGREAAGFASLQVTPYADTGYLHRAAVLPKFRGNRLQARFIRAREAKAATLGMTRLVSDTTDSVTSSNNLIRAGYHLFAPKFLWAWTYSLYWQKDI